MIQEPITYIRPEQSITADVSLQPATRGQWRCFGFTFVRLYVVKGVITMDVC